MSEDTQSTVLVAVDSPQNPEQQKDAQASGTKQIKIEGKVLSAYSLEELNSFMPRAMRGGKGFGADVREALWTEINSRTTTEGDDTEESSEDEYVPFTMRYDGEAFALRAEELNPAWICIAMYLPKTADTVQRLTEARTTFGNAEAAQDNVDAVKYQLDTDLAAIEAETAAKLAQVPPDVKDWFKTTADEANAAKIASLKAKAEKETAKYQSELTSAESGRPLWQAMLGRAKSTKVQGRASKQTVMAHPWQLIAPKAHQGMIFVPDPSGDTWTVYTDNKRDNVAFSSENVHHVPSSPSDLGHLSMWIGAHGVDETNAAIADGSYKDRHATSWRVSVRPLSE